VAIAFLAVFCLCGCQDETRPDAAEEETSAGKPVEELPLSSAHATASSANGVSFQLAVSPLDGEGEYITAGISIESFTFAGIQAQPLDGPLVTIPGTAEPIKYLELPGTEEQSLNAAMVVVIDNSGSMELNDPDSLRIDAAVDLVESLRPDDVVAVIHFASNVFIAQQFTADKQIAAGAIRHGMVIGQTALWDAVDTALDALEAFESADGMVLAPSDYMPMVLLLTDGQDNVSDHGFGPVLGKAKAGKTSVFSIGLGHQLDFSLLTTLAVETGGAFAQAQDADALADLFAAQGVATAKGRVIVYGEGKFDAPMLYKKDYKVSGILLADINGSELVSPFSFLVRVGQTSGGAAYNPGSGADGSANDPEGEGADSEEQSVEESEEDPNEDLSDLFSG